VANQRALAPSRAVIRDLYVPVLTPFDERGAISGRALARHCEWIMGNGARGVMLFGTTGEGPSIGVAEKLDAIRALSVAQPDLPVIAAVMQAALPEAIACIRGYNEFPLVGILVLPPFFFRDADPAGITDFLATAAAASDHPVLAYHIPSLAPEVPLDVAAIPGVWGVKDSGGDLGYTKAALAAGNAVMVGAENTIPAAMLAGAAGTISGMANLMPVELAAVCAAARAGDLADAEARLKPVLQLRDQMMAGAPGMEWIAAMKAIATHRHGIDLGGVRTPLRGTDDYLTAEIRRSVGAASE
jgi:dihydrodipicolinate synthase/N-acetylneuraminate lyase